MGPSFSHTNTSTVYSNCSLTEELVTISPLRFQQSWVSHETAATSGPPLVQSALTTERREPSRRVVNQRTPVSATNEFILYAPEVVTQNTEPSASNPATSAGVARVSPAKSVSSSSPTTLPTTNSSEPTP